MQSLMSLLAAEFGTKGVAVETQLSQGGWLAFLHDNLVHICPCMWHSVSLYRLIIGR